MNNNKNNKTAVPLFFSSKEEEKEFMELIETNDINCIICNVMIGDKYQVIEHFRIRHPHIYETVKKREEEELLK